MNKQELITKATKAVERSVDAVRNATGSELALVYVVYPYTTAFDKATGLAVSIAKTTLDEAQTYNKGYITSTIVYSPGVEEVLQSQNCVVFKLTQSDDDCEEETLDIEIYHSLSRDTVHTFSASGWGDSWEAESRTPKVQPEKDRQELEEIYTQAADLVELINKETNGGWGGFLDVGGRVFLPTRSTKGQTYFSPLGLTTFFTIKEEVTRLMSQCMEQNVGFTTTMQLYAQTEHGLKQMEIKEFFYHTLPPMAGQPLTPFPNGPQYPSMYGQAMQQTPPWMAMPQNYGNPGFQMQSMQPGMYVQMYTGQPMQPQGQSYHYTSPTKGKKD